MGKPPRNPKKNYRGRRKLRDMLSAAEWAVYEPPNKDELAVARVYVNYGIECGAYLEGDLVRLANQRHLPVVAGDMVYTDGRTVLGIQPRGKVLARFADEGGVRLIASHLDQVGLVCSASLPPNHEGFIDRYLVYCRIVDLPLFIVLNKVDELDEEEASKVLAFEDAGVDIYPTSAITGKGMKQLEKRLKQGNTVLSGLSGVGKSTIINWLLDEDIPVQEVSQATRRGRHTTTTSEAYELGDILLIDTPGIKKFGFLGVPRGDVIKGFPEFLPHAGGCRFDDCQHLEEEGCAVRQAVETGELDERRYRAYADLMETIEEEQAPR
jgi:ribosome biogenesis GTPase / thiamine phosphate phosphatase